eukprot:SAG11_NODE_7399_length_1149_cov_3.400000_1_plen_129_part_10
MARLLMVYSCVQPGLVVDLKGRAGGVLQMQTQMSDKPHQGWAPVVNAVAIHQLANPHELSVATDQRPFSVRRGRPWSGLADVSPISSTGGQRAATGMLPLPRERRPERIPKVANLRVGCGDGIQNRRQV